MIPHFKRTKTAQNKAYARFTMLVFFKKEFQKANKATGEIYEKWTYRADLELEKFKKQGRYFDNEKDALTYIFQRDRHKYTRVVSYDNHSETNQILREFLTDEKGILQRVF